LDGKPLAYLIRKRSIEDERSGNQDKRQLLQVCGKKLEAGRRFEAHRHLPIVRETSGTQEVWIVIEGEVIVMLYDVNDEQLESVTLQEGDCFVTYRGGHSMMATHDSIIYEVKNGPYISTQSDKAFI
jgi:cupin fold WbuC family metalloprotein